MITPAFLLFSLACRHKDLVDTGDTHGPGYDSVTNGDDDSSDDSPITESPTDDSPPDSPPDSPVDTGDPVPLMCPSSGLSDREQLTLWGSDGADLWLMHADYSSFIVHTFGADFSLPSGLSPNVGARISGPVLGAVAAWSDSGSGQAWSELILFDAAGNLLARTTNGGSWSTMIYLGESGILAYDRGPIDVMDSSQGYNDGLALYPDGTTVELAGWHPIGWEVDGYVPVCSTDNTSCAWVDPLDLANPILSRPYPDQSQIYTSGRVIWVDDDLNGQGPGVAWETPAGTNTASLSGIFPLEADPFLRIIDDQDEGYILVSWSQVPWEHPDLSTLAWVDVNTGTVRSVSPTLPDGWRLFEDSSYCPGPSVQLTSLGELNFMLRTDSIAAMWNTDVDLHDWERWGSGFTDVYGLWMVEHAGTAQILGSSGSNAPCSARTWTPDSSGESLIGGDNIQILMNNGAGPSVELPAQGTPGNWPLEPTNMTGDGKCSMYFDPRGGGDPVPTIIDIEAGTETPLTDPPDRWYWLY